MDKETRSKLNLEALQEAMEAVNEILKQFDQESDEDNLTDDRCFLEASLHDLEEGIYNPVLDLYYKADKKLDEAEKLFESLRNAIQNNINTHPIPDLVLDTIASELRGWLGDACSDIAYGAIRGGFMDKETADKVAKAKANGVTDIPGWYADEIYNDPDTIGDILGDRIHDAAKGDDKMMVAIAKRIHDNNPDHDALGIAMEKFIERHTKDMEHISKVVGKAVKHLSEK